MILPQELSRTLTHLACGLVGKGNREQPRRAHVAGGDQPGDARSEHARLAAARAGKNQRVLIRQRDGGELFRIEIVEQRHRTVRDFKTAILQHGFRLILACLSGSTTSSVCNAIDQ